MKIKKSRPRTVTLNDRCFNEVEIREKQQKPELRERMKKLPGQSRTVKVFLSMP